MKYILDACSLIAYFNEEEGHSAVASVLKDAANGKAEVFIHGINLYEFQYDLLKSCDKNLAEETMKVFENLPVGVIDVVGKKLREEAARFKVSYKISVADSFALATAKIEDATLVTADHHEFDVIDEANEIAILWFR